MIHKISRLLMTLAALFAATTGAWAQSTTPATIYNAMGSFKFYYTAEPESSTPEVIWDAATKTGTLTMPGADVEVEVEYWDEATVSGTATAAEGVHIGEDKALLSGLSTEHGTLVYAITAATVTTAPADDQFDAAYNTAKNKDITAAGTWRVWYYVNPDASHSPSVPAYKDVEVLTDKYNITFQPANALTIQGGYATVKVGDATKTLDDEGQLKQVTMNQTVTLTAKQGYKFRKVEAKNDITVTKN